MARFFIAASNIVGGVAYLDSKAMDHIKVLRIRNGETFTVCDGSGTDYECRLADTQGANGVAQVLSCAPSGAEPSVKVTVFAAWPKGDKAELIVQKCVELGAGEIVFFPSSRCVVKVDAAGAQKKVMRLGRIAEEAAKQSGRGVIPAVTAAGSFADAVKAACGHDCALFLYEDEKTLGLRTVLEENGKAKSFALMTGPEGGFSPEEADAAAKAGMRSTVMGPRILRCETAPICALTAVMLMSGNMQEGK